MPRSPGGGPFGSPGKPTSWASSRSGSSTTSTRSRTRPTRSRSNRSPRSRPWPPRPARSGWGTSSSAPGSATPRSSRRWSRRSTSISGGRMELGIGAGWKRDEWVAYGYEFPETPERLARLGDDLEVITRMLAPGRTVHATFHGPTRERRRRDQRPQAAPGAPADRRRRQRPQRHLATRRALRRRGQPRQGDAGRRREGPADHPVALRGDRAGPRLAPGLGPHLAPRQGRAGPGADRPAGGLPRARRGADHRIPPGLGARPGRARGLRRRHGPGRLRPARRLAGSPGTPRSRSDLRDHERRTLGTSCQPSASRWTGIRRPNAVQAVARGVATSPGCRKPNWRRRTHVYSKGDCVPVDRSRGIRGL